ncbi:SDR family NAD(P)-dependent oxidoreductase [Bradyrhizobium sp. SSUT112]|uniref:SDR family oxidoreductase n=1 Tax=Bradyrhizobium sp. SSUT112 TaxID=3040604 RepID=UPI002447CA07|nr:SDR family NAD(P)-dependent oxidoreductase [Bradyrhizobium sp. SSUT112]MDH2352323.1 SDR family NAD(P)-dependent oxidoreductase [Bradyrhizobium sp. SSUT112]
MDKRPHALVTGASSGIGAAIVERLLRDGWRVTGISRRPAPFDHPAFDHLSLDLADIEAIAAAVADIVPTALVHAAGMLKVGQLGSLDHDAGAAMWRLHVDVAERLANALAPRLKQGGRIVFIGSRTASGASGRGQYAATKAALVALARSWAIELAPRGVTVNVVAPAATETPMLKDPSRTDVAPKLPPIGRYIRSDEVAHAVAFLLSADAAAITGQQLVICGGSSL